MHDDADHQAIKELLEQSQIMIAVSIGVLLLMNIPTGSGGSIGFLGAAIGAGVGGWGMTRPWATPLSLVPRAPGFLQEVAQEEQLLENLKPALTSIRQTRSRKIRRISILVAGFLGL